jgi:hypothetical protein
MIDFTQDGDVELAEIEVLRGALDSYKDRFGPHHPLVMDVTERLACAYWRLGYPSRAVVLLETTVAALPDEALSARADLLDLVWKISFGQRCFESARHVLCEVYEIRVRFGGDCSADALAAQGDLAIVLFEMGRIAEAESSVRDALAKAQKHLRERDPVTTVIAWNCVLIHERRNETEQAMAVAVTHLLWLLGEDAATLDPDLAEIRSWLADRFSWDTAPAC